MDIGSKAAIGALVTVAALGATALPAHAAGSNFVSGYTDPYGAWTRLNTDRHVTTPNDTIIFNPDNLTSGGTGMYLIKASTGTRFSNVVNYYSTGAAKTLATGVLDGTVFKVYVRKLNSGGSDDYFDGHMWY